MILFGHPTGAPFVHHAALAHFEEGQLEGFCVSWMPSELTLAMFGHIPRIRDYAKRLSRRRFPALDGARLVEGKLGEWSRMTQRVAFGGRFASERLSYEANDWLMRTMRRESRRPQVTAVHSYEDCSLWSFEEAKHRGKACIYNLPIGYYFSWEQRQEELARQYEDWLPPGGMGATRYVRPEQKRKEMELADLVLVPCTFVKSTVEQFIDKKVALAPFGVDLEFWQPIEEKKTRCGPLRFIFAGQCSLRKGIPGLLQAWRKAELKDATLDLVGGWHFSSTKKEALPAGVTWHGPCSSVQLRKHYQESDIFVFPSFFEGFGLVILEAMACGLPVITTTATAGPDVLSPDCGRIVSPGDIDALVESLRWFDRNRETVSAMGIASRAHAEMHTWKNYRECVKKATSELI